MKADLKNLKKQIKQKRKDLEMKAMPPDAAASLLLRPLLSLRKISLNYTENKATSVAGFMPQTQILGNNNALAAPGYGFAFGAQPGDRFFLGTDATAREAWLDNAAAKGWMSRDTILNQQFTQTRQSHLDITASFEPFQDFRIDLSVLRDYTQNYSEMFKVTTTDGGFQHLVPMTMGSYSISFFSLNTFFQKIDSTGITQTYKQFETNREIISQRLGIPGSVYENPSDASQNPNYTYGYGPKAQQVLIPAFLAAYTKSDAHKVGLGLFNKIPIPNWKITYNGLSKIKWLQNVFTSITLTHAYSSTLTINSYATNLHATDPNTTDSLNGNYYAALAIPSIVITEQFSPLIGIDLTTKNQISAKFNYSKSRTLMVNFSDYQLIENNSTTITIGAGYTIRGLKLPISIKGKKLRLDNDLKFNLNISYRDNSVINHLIDNGNPQITSGSKNIIINPTVDYMINNRIDVQFFINYNKTIPMISTSFPTTNVQGGLNFRISLAQ